MMLSLKKFDIEGLSKETNKKFDIEDLSKETNKKFDIEGLSKETNKKFDIEGLSKETNKKFCKKIENKYYEMKKGQRKYNISNIYYKTSMGNEIKNDDTDDIKYTLIKDALERTYFNLKFVMHTVLFLYLGAISFGFRDDIITMFEMFIPLYGNEFLRFLENWIRLGDKIKNSPEYANVKTKNTMLKLYLSPEEEKWRTEDILSPSYLSDEEVNKAIGRKKKEMAK